MEVAYGLQDSLEHRVKVEMVEIYRGNTGIAIVGFPDRQQSRDGHYGVAIHTYPDVERIKRSVT